MLDVLVPRSFLVVTVRKGFESVGRYHDSSLFSFHSRVSTKQSVQLDRKYVRGSNHESEAHSA